MPKGFKKVSDSIKIQRKRQNSRIYDEVIETPQFSTSTYGRQRTSAKMKFVLVKQRGHILTMVQCPDDSTCTLTSNSTRVQHSRKSYSPSSTDSERAAALKPIGNYFGDNDNEISQEERPKKKKVKVSTSKLLAGSKNVKPKKVRHEPVKSAMKNVDDHKENLGTYKEEPLRRNLRERKAVKYNDNFVTEENQPRRPLDTVTLNKIVPKKTTQNNNKNASDSSMAHYDEIGLLPSREQSSSNIERLLSRSMCFDEAPVQPSNKISKKVQSRDKSDEPDSEATEIIDPLSTELSRRKGSKVNQIASILARKRESHVVTDDDFEISTKHLDKLRALKGASQKNTDGHDLNLSKESFFEGSTVPEAEPAVTQEPLKKRRGRPPKAAIKPKQLQNTVEASENTNTLNVGANPLTETRFTIPEAEPAVNHEPPKKRRGRPPKAANEPKQSQNVLETTGITKSLDVGVTPKTGTKRKSSATNSHLRSSFFPRRKFYYPTENGTETIRFAGFYKPPKAEDEDRVSVSTLSKAKVGHVGYLHIPVGQSKPATMAKTNLIYNSLKGEGEVTIHNKKAIVKAPKTFVVPKGAFYSISNTGEITFSLLFVIDNEN